jgi:hypothetical protein
MQNGGGSSGPTIRKENCSVQSNRVTGSERLNFATRIVAQSCDNFPSSCWLRYRQQQGHCFPFSLQNVQVILCSSSQLPYYP